MTRARLLVLASLALVCAACGGNPPAAHPTAAASQHAAGSSTASPAGGALAQGTSVAGPPGESSDHGGAVATAGAGATAVRPATASGPPAAAPGTYPISGSYSSTSTTQPSPSQTSGTGTLTITAAQASQAGNEQDQTYHFGSDSLLTHDVFTAGGEVDVSRSGSASFSPALPVVPAGLHDGMSWGPLSFTSGSSTGTLSGSAGQTGQQTVGGVAVTVVPITLRIQLSGSFHGTPYTATAVETMAWAPSLHLAVHERMVTDARYAAASQYHSELEVSLLATRPR